jgi:quercetin dioxygenase-like cupin family protein
MARAGADALPMSATTTTSHARRIWNPVQQDAATLLESAEETGGERSVFEIELSPGGSNMPHRHLTYAEHFHVLEGTLTIELEGETLRLEPGDVAVAEAGALHNFRNETGEQARYLVELRPGHRGFERALQVGYGLARDGRVTRDGLPRNVLHLALLGEWAELRASGPLRALHPFLGLLARIARRRGIDAQLGERYCAW